MDKVLTLIMTTESYIERQNAIRETWGKDIDFLFYSEHKDLDVIQVVDKEEKENVVLKTKNLLKLIIEKEIYFKNNRIDSYDWVFFVDDDTFINPPILKNILTFLDKNIVYGYLFGGVRNIKENFLNGGAGILISMDMLKQIKDLNLYISVHHGDVAFSHILKNNNIKYIHYPLFNFKMPEFPFDTKEIIMTQLTYHHVKPLEMKELYNMATGPVTRRRDERK